MTLRFDHAVVATRDLASAAAAYETLGFRVEPGGRHLGKGTQNALIRFGTDYVELLAVDDREEALASGPSRRDLVARLDARGDGLSTFAVATGALDAAVGERLRAAGVEAPPVATTERRRPDGSLLRWQTLVPEGSTVGRPWPFLIAWPQGSMSTGVTPVVHPNGVTAVAGLDVLAGDVAQAGRVYAALGLPLGPSNAGARLGAWRLTVAAASGPDAAPGPQLVRLAVPDLEAFLRFAHDRGLGTHPAPGGGVRLADAHPALAMLVFGLG